MNQRFEKTVEIDSEDRKIWQVLTEPALMKQWMGDREMNLEINTDWRLHGPITISGVHHARFENKGTIIAYEENKTLAYTHLSSVSRLEDKAANYSIIKFNLTPAGEKTSLTLTIENFPTETIYKHLCFYWRTTMEKIKALVEEKI